MKMIFAVLFCSLFFFSCKKADSIRQPTTKEIPPKADPKIPPTAPGATGNSGTKTPSPVTGPPADKTVTLDATPLILTDSGKQWVFNVVEAKNIREKNLITRTFTYRADKKMILDFKNGWQQWSLSKCSKSPTELTTIMIKGKQLGSIFTTVSDLVLEKDEDMQVIVAINNTNCEDIKFEFGVQYSWANEPVAVTPTPAPVAGQPGQVAPPATVPVTVPVGSPATSQSDILTVKTEEFLSSNEGECLTFSCLLRKMVGIVPAKQDPNNPSGVVREYIRSFGPAVTFGCVDKYDSVVFQTFWKSTCVLTVNPTLSNDAVVIKRGPGIKANLISVDILDKHLVLSITKIFPTIYNTIQKVEVSKNETEKVAIPRLSLTCSEDSAKKLSCRFLGVLN